VWGWLAAFFKKAAAVEQPPAEQLTIDKDGWLHGPNVERIPSERHQKLATPGSDPEGVVWHYTTTLGGTGLPLAKRIVKMPGVGERSASWHLSIERDGKIYQSVPFRRGSWHAGGDTAKRFVRGVSGWQIAPHGVSANSWAIGVEFVNGGQVRLVKDTWRIWPFEEKSAGVPAEQVRKSDDGKCWQSFTAAQETTAAALLEVLKKQYGIKGRAARWGHSQIDPGRKEDPGPIWLARLATLTREE
jgi:N-acetylmuramoyl-L-alanine amidase